MDYCQISEMIGGITLLKHKTKLKTHLKKKAIMTIQIMNCYDDKVDVDIGKLNEISEISILVLSGDEILKVWKKDGSTIEEDSDRHGRSMNFFDGEYWIYDSDKGINRIDEWAKRKDSYDWVM